MEDKVRQAERLIARCASIFTEDGMCVSFNGGKDCTVVLHLLRRALPKTFHRVQLLFFRQKAEFPQVTEFVARIAAEYNFVLFETDDPIKIGLANFVETSKVKCILMGTRRTDPRSSNLAPISISDEGWPDFLRAHPVLDWTPADIWGFLRTYELPYCPLYDEGYTSLGLIHNTTKNPSLQRKDGTFRPAYELIDDGTERNGRDAQVS